MEKYGGAEEATDDNIIRRMRVACWINKATRSHTNTQKYVTLIAFPQQQWLCQRAATLRYTYTAFPVPNLWQQI